MESYQTPCESRTKQLPPLFPFPTAGPVLGGGQQCSNSGFARLEPPLTIRQRGVLTYMIRDQRMEMFSRILLSIGSRDIGLNSLGFFVPCLLGIGTTLELFQAVGGRPS